MVASFHSVLLEGLLFNLSPDYGRTRARFPLQRTSALLNHSLKLDALVLELWSRRMPSTDDKLLFVQAQIYSALIDKVRFNRHLGNGMKRVER